MQLDDFQFPFDPSLIASRPVRPRDQAKLLVVPRRTGPYQDHRIVDLPRLLNPGDLVIVNNTKVIPAKLSGTKSPTGGKVELLVVRSCGEDRWEVLIKGKVHAGQRISLEGGAEARVEERSQERTVIAVKSPEPWMEYVQRVGQMPLPPYLKRQATTEDTHDYQTIFAQTAGAIAAPTAGLHFTSRILEELNRRGINVAPITLHVGLGTFRPVTVDRIEDHQMEGEWFQISNETAHAINRTKEKGGRVVAVGTTVTRSLETACDANGHIKSQEGYTNLFVTPGYEFRVVDVLMTNFHLPGTTLLMLLAAFTGLEQSRLAYEHAVKERYRFYSYGDAMLIQ
ncbi:MAG: tRNA preQ1(34) S-adenosylmethionine ribosyltransferase-isomerase QueA [Nitrospirales bacterium]|nr:tRNA preQ1(34) S-adenosylmethionine ribosyltransferase-isomerase QueA [Nitrospira sp.]MDR4502039.1 tRNA preQ1(34) S-adenosylmethionine ribosyltransferase-isomerase QueA [Nitrospirales bacterium]